MMRLLSDMFPAGSSVALAIGICFSGGCAAGTKRGVREVASWPSCSKPPVWRRSWQRHCSVVTVHGVFYPPKLVMFVRCWRGTATCLSGRMRLHGSIAGAITGEEVIVWREPGPGAVLRLRCPPPPVQIPLGHSFFF